MADRVAVKSELEQIAQAWHSIRVTYAGSPPTDVETSESWDRAIQLSLLVKRADSGEQDFAEAWHTAVKQLRELIWERLQPWAVRFVQAYPVTFTFESIPDPPTDFVPVASTHAVSDLALATGTPDTLEAGRRIVFWCLADWQPETMRRTQEHCNFFHRWTSRVLTFSQTTIQPMNALIEALLVVTDHLAASAASPGQPSSGVCPVILEGMPEIRRVGDSEFLLIYEGQTVHLCGKTAERLVRLLQEGRATVLELQCGPTGGQERPALASGENDVQSTRTVAEYKEMNPSDRRKYIAQLKETRKANEHALSQIRNEGQREKISKDNDFITKELNSLRRVPKDSDAKARESLRKGFARLWDKLNKKESSHPLGQYLKKHISLTPDKSAYEYTGDLAWEYLEIS